jgi:Domain of unknown function (DUF5916)/Carbohydrate family 9 binding domain-like
LFILALYLCPDDDEMRAVRNVVAPLVIAAVVVPSAGAREKDPLAITSRSKTPIVIQRLVRPVVFDGLSEEEAWKDIPVFSLTMMMPNYGLTPSEKTEVQVAFDDEYLWVAGRLFDREPGRIQARSKKRDLKEVNSDMFGVLFDTFNDKENALSFSTTPTGLRWDAAIYNDAQTHLPQEEPFNLSWNTFWDVRTVVNAQGWFVEMRIPLSSLRFQEKDGDVVMGFSAFRWIARKNENDVFPDIYPKWGMMSAFKPSQAQEVSLTGLHSKNPLYISPYVLPGTGYSYDLNTEETEYIRTDVPPVEAGLDVKYGLSSHMTLDVTINPDFAQVEADDQQVNLTRYSILFPEKRLFFQERASIFDFSFGAFSRLFYSRRIGLYEDEEQEISHVVPIYGGVRMIGRAGSWDLGFLDMQTAPYEEAALPSENFGVVRLRRRILNPYSYVGAMITSRIGVDGSYNEAYGFDGILRVSGDNYLSFGWAQTFENGRTNNPVSLDPARFRVAYERRTQKGWGTYLGLSRAGKDYVPGMGFEYREDFTAGRGEILYGWIPGEKSSLQSHSVRLNGMLSLRNADRSLESAELGPGWEFNTKSGWGGRFTYQFQRESLVELLEFSDEVNVPPGEYSFSGFQGDFHAPMGGLLGAMSMVEIGSFYDGWRTTVSIMPTWSILPDLSLGGQYQYNRVKFPERNQDLLAHLVQVRLLATLSTKISILTFVQYNGVDDLVVGNVRFRYNPREGNDLYLVYNEVLNTDRAGKIPYPPSSGARAILLKYTYTFNL